MTDPHVQTPLRRSQDYGIGKLLRWSPLVGSAVLAFISIGGYIATIKFMGDRQNKQDILIEAVQKTQVAQVGINSQLTEITREHDRRINSIEDWRNGVSDSYITGHRRR